MSGIDRGLKSIVRHPTWRQDEWRAFQEFLSMRGLSYSYLGYVPSHQQVCVVMEDKSQSGMA